MTLIDRLDAAAGKTGIPGMAMSPLRRRRLRWLPILVLLLGFGGYLAVLLSPARSTTGFTAIGLATGISCWFPLFGPLKIGGGGEFADEFDRTAAMRSYLVALVAVTIFTFISLLLLAGLTLMLRWTRETLLMDVVATAMMMQVNGLALPTLHASWTIQPVDEGEDED